MDTPSIAQLQVLAIEAALDGRFHEAITFNNQIIKIDSNNVNALARLGRAYCELGKISQAKKYYSLVLGLDPYNPIAIKNLKILKTVKKNSLALTDNHTGRVSSSLFLQEPGKTKVVSLIKVAEPQKLSALHSGMPVKINVKSRRVTIQDRQDTYLGVVPDDISHRLVRFIKGGNKYEVFIKSIKVNGLSVLIRELYRSKRFKNQPSFLDSSDSPQTREIFTSQDEDTEDEDNVDEGSEEELTY